MRACKFSFHLKIYVDFVVIKKYMLLCSQKMIKVQISDKLKKLNERREYKININSLEFYVKDFVVMKKIRYLNKNLCQRLFSNEKKINIYKKSALPSLTAYSPSWAFT